MPQSTDTWETFVFDFETDGSGAAMGAGDIVDAQYQDLGLTISANQRRSKTDLAMVFDSNNPTGGDDDLDYASLENKPGNILIISEDGDQSDPDDSARGGSITFNFDAPVDLTSIVALDAERGGVFRAFDDAGNLVGKVRFGGTEDNGLVEVDLSSLTNVSKLVARVKGSGALDDLTVKRKVVPPPNEAPEAADVEVAGDAGSPLDGTVVASDADGDLLSFRLGDAPSGGEVALQDDGDFTYTPEAGFFGSDSFTVIVDDGRGGETEATVTVNIAPPPPVLTATDDTASAAEDGAVTIPVLSNDIAGEIGGLFLGNLGTPMFGQVVANPDGSVTYTPAPDFNGHDSFTYVLNSFDLSDRQKALVDATQTRDALVARIDFLEARVAFNEARLSELPLLIATEQSEVTARQFVLTGLELELAILSEPDLVPPTDPSVLAVLEGQINAARLQVAVAESARDRLVREQSQLEAEAVELPLARADLPGAEQAVIEAQAALDQVTSDIGTVTVTVLAVNDAPVALADSAEVLEDSTVKIDVLVNDTDIDSATVTVEMASDGAHGTTMVNADGTITYTPEANFFGTDTFTYIATDGQDSSNEARVTVTVRPQQDPPIAVDDTAITGQGETVLIDVLANDSDPDGDPISLVSATQPANGTVQLNDDGTISYTPGADFLGTDSFDYVVGSVAPGSFAAELQAAQAAQAEAEAALAVFDAEANGIRNEISEANISAGEARAGIVRLSQGIAQLQLEREEFFQQDIVGFVPTFPPRPLAEIEAALNNAIFLRNSDTARLVASEAQAREAQERLDALLEGRPPLEAELDAAIAEVAAVEAQIANGSQDIGTVFIGVGSIQSSALEPVTADPEDAHLLHSVQGSDGEEWIL